MGAAPATQIGPPSLSQNPVPYTLPQETMDAVQINNQAKTINKGIDAINPIVTHPATACLMGAGQSFLGMMGIAAGYFGQSNYITRPFSNAATIKGLNDMYSGIGNMDKGLRGSGFSPMPQLPTFVPPSFSPPSRGHERP